MKMKAKGYRRGGAPMGMAKPGNERATSARKAPKLSSVQESMLRQAQGMVKSSGQNPAEMQRLTGLYGDLNAPKGAKMAAAEGGKKTPARGRARNMGPQRRSMGGAMKAKGMKKGGKVGGSSRSGATSGFKAPSSKPSGLYGK